MDIWYSVLVGLESSMGAPISLSVRELLEHINAFRLNRLEYQLRRKSALLELKSMGYSMRSGRMVSIRETKFTEPYQFDLVYDLTILEQVPRYGSGKC